MKKWMKKMNVVLLAGLCVSGCGMGSFQKSEQGQMKTQEENEETTEQSEAGAPDTAEPENQAQEAGQPEQEASGTEEGQAQISPLRKDVENLTVLFADEWLSKWNKEKTKYILETSYNIPKLSAEDGEEYPELEKALAQYGSAERKRMKKFFKSTAKEAQEVGTDDREWFIRSWQSVARADNRVVSLMTKYTDYTGGAHGLFYTDGISFDSETGKKLSLKDVFVSTDELPAILEKKLIKKYGRDAFFNSEKEGTSIFAPIMEANRMLEEMETEQKSESEQSSDGGNSPDSGKIVLKEENYTWCITNDGVIFYFAPYQIGPYGSGEFECLIPFRQKDLFQPVYTETAKKYARELAWDWKDETGGGLRYEADLDGDGMQDKLAIEWISCDEYVSGDCNVKITYKGVKWKKVIHGYSFSPVLMHMKNGKNYLYLGVTMENDYPDMFIFSLTKKGVKKIGRRSLEFHGETDKDERYYTSAPSDPEKFKLDTRLDVLSTYTGWKKYHVGKKGLPVADTPYYHIETSLVMTSLKSMKLVIVDEKGKKIKTARIPKGKKFAFYRTDAKTFVDMKLPSGTICRLHLNRKGKDWWEDQKVEGKPLEKMFEGYMFAG